MPLPIKKIRKTTASNALSALIVTSEVAKEIADIMQFPPAQAAAGILLLVFETIQKMQSNRETCYRLAHRCLTMLADIRDHMTDRWDSAPPSLLKAISRFEETLESIHKFMKQEAEQKWSTRLLRKSTIELAMDQYHVALDDAARSFQIATLINIHLAVGDSSKGPKNVDSSGSTQPSSGQSRESTLPPYSGEQPSITDNEICLSPEATIGSFAIVEADKLRGSSSNEYEVVSIASHSSSLSTASDMEEEFQITDHHGFNQYHQSQFRMKGKSRIKSGWWSGGMEGDIDGSRSLMLRYEGSRQVAMKRWMRDVKILQNLYHPNLPQMMGYSNNETPTPFILLANVQTRLPQAMLLDAIKNASLAECTQLLLHFYQDTLDAALYLQRQKSLSDSKLQDYIEHADFRVDERRTVVMGLPPPEVDNIQSWRNFGLAYSIRDVFLQLLPNRGYAREPVDPSDHTLPEERQRKISHLAVLARALLPGQDDITSVKERLQKIIHAVDEEDEEADIPPMSLRQIRKAAFSVDTHQQAWHKNTVPPHKYAVGDLGYLPEGSNDWDDFVVCCNVLKDGLAQFDVTSSVTGKQGMWANRVYERQDLMPFELPAGIFGWPVVVPPEAEYSVYIVHETAATRVQQTWNYLLDAGRELAKQHGVRPEDLILMTRIGNEQRFRVRDLRKIQYWPASTATHSHNGAALPTHRQHGSADPFARHPFGHHHPGGNQGMLVYGQDLAPKVFYLFTSGDKRYQAHFTDRPMPASVLEDEKPPELNPNAVKCFAYPEATYGFLDYVQLHEEDFAD